MLFSYKFFTISQLPNKFYITKSTTIHTKPTTTQHRNHQNSTTHTTTTTKKKIRDQRGKVDLRRDRPRGGDRSASCGWWDRPRGGDDLTKRRRRPVKRQQASCGAISAGRSRWREVDGAISPARLGLGRDLANVFGSVKSKALSLSLSFFARLSPEMVWSENRNVKQFPSQSLYFTVKWNVFPENSIFYAHPNTQWGVKWFLEMVWSQNKRSLSCNFWQSHLVSARPRWPTNYNLLKFRRDKPVEILSKLLIYAGLHWTGTWCWMWLCIFQLGL